MSKDTTHDQQAEAAKSQKPSSRKDKKLDTRLAELERQVEQLTTDVKRERADFMNYKRRSELDRSQVMEAATHQIVSQLLPLFDDLERALAAIPDDIADNPWAKGVSQIHRQVQAKLADLGVSRIDCLGKPFDPSLHEAIGFEDGEGAEEVVTEELRSGYQLGETVLRPSMVKVGKTDATNSGPAGKEEA